MKHFAFVGVALIGFISSIAAAAPPETLTLQDLIKRPDHWPATVSLVGDFKFGNGMVVHQSDKLRIASFDGTRLRLVGPANALFVVKPQDSDLLDAANQAWAALTPAQRAVDPDSLAADPSLWPPRVTTITQFSSKFGILPAGSEVAVVTVTNQSVAVAMPNSSNYVTSDLATTDLIDRARKLVLIDPDKRPSRIAMALEKIMVDADGKPFHDDHLQDKKIFALYFGANWCPPCHAFSPDFVKFMDDALPRHPELAAVLLSNDHQPDEMLAYMKDAKMPFPAVYPKDLDQSAVLSSYAAEMIPHLVIVDRFGKVLATNVDDRGERTDPKDTIEALNKLLTAPTARP